MGSITKDDLIVAIEEYPNDAEVIFEISEKGQDGKPKHSIAYINGIKYDKDFNEIRLMN